ncbi:phosphoenolpyruvate--protein phosphotransferase [Lentisphaera profundi]|uniref:phosphoenolpyruvate--protein phosphotransferase n=1 Tax=Lentisphaera profundi TaxID=1658616 RepID=A0ABY7VUB8_9BACT|nr:phosphoenolpyruvate--protein phosphotransferase [Lentisphaera profundi]WDE97805.1 phosphoenolpyruvate--protein phosphotransferase [Lentisphaera profundi]
MSDIVDILKEVTNSILNHDPTSKILQKVTELVCEKLHLDVCSIYTFDSKKKTLNLRANTGFLKKTQVSFSIKEGLTGLVYREQNALNLTKPMDHPSFTLVNSIGEEKFQSYLGIPMIDSSGLTLGCFVIQTRFTSMLDESAVDLANTLASQMATLISQEGLQRVLSDHTIQDRDEIAQALEDDEPDSHIDLKLEGSAVSPGVIHGPIRMLNTREIWDRIVLETGENRQIETGRLEEALKLSCEETVHIQERAQKVFIEADASIFFAQLLLLEDENFIKDMYFGIDFYSYTAEASVKNTVEKYIKKFQEARLPQLRERALDLLDVGIRLILQLQGLGLEQEVSQQKVILVAPEIMPSDLVRIPNENILAIVCSHGGSTSHTAILSRSLQIPAVMGVNDIDELCEAGDTFLVDGDNGSIVINPGDEILKMYEERLSVGVVNIEHPTVNLPTLSKDQVSIKMRGNICMVSDFKLLEKVQNDGVGLYRTEFMFMMHENFPVENEQYRIFRQVAKLGEPNSVVIRALDIGGDKPLSYFDHGTETDPMLGYRSIRILLEHPEVFIPHLRAMLRAAQRGNMKILFPMIAHYEDVVALKKVIKEQVAELRKIYGRKFKIPPLGAMIEMPSAVCQLNELLDYFDFVSIGTNDLVQYFFAVDRGNKKVSNYFCPMHPLILRVLKKIIDSCTERNKPVSICGEIASNPLATPILIGIGLIDFSMTPMQLSKIKHLTSQLDSKKCSKLARKALQCSTQQEVIDLVEAFYKKEKISIEY